MVAPARVFPPLLGIAPSQAKADLDEIMLVVPSYRVELNEAQCLAFVRPLSSSGLPAIEGACTPLTPLASLQLGESECAGANLR